MEPPELIPGVKRVTFKQLRGSNYWYPCAIKRCRHCGTCYAPYQALWSDEPDTCAICAAMVPEPKQPTNGGSHD